MAVHSGNGGYPSGSYYYQPAVPSTLSSTTIRSYSEAEKDVLLESALNAAWEQYGPKSKPRVPAVSPATYAHRDTSVYDEVYNGEGLSGFQPSGSEWDQHVSSVPVVRRPPAVEPTFFTRLLSNYINFEVNHHEVADFMRRAVFFGFVGLLMVGWIALGFWIGLLPFKIFGAAGRKREVEEGNSIVSEITDRVMLALDQNWLQRLQERIQNSENARSWTHIQCCLLPDTKARGMTDCHPIRRGSKDSTWKCLSDLIYNIQFGPAEPVRRADKRKQTLKKSSAS